MEITHIGSVVTHKFDNKDQLDNWARHTVKNPNTLLAVLKPTYVKASTVQRTALDEAALTKEC